MAFYLATTLPEIVDAAETFGSQPITPRQAVSRGSLVEGRKLTASGLDRYDPGKTVQPYFEPAGIINLRYNTDIGERDLVAEGIAALAEQRLQRGKTLRVSSDGTRYRSCLVAGLARFSDSGAAPHY